MQTINQASAAIHLELNRMYEGHAELAELLQALVTTAQTGSQEATEQAQWEIFHAEGRLYEGHAELAELLQALVTAARAENAAPAPA